MSEAEKHWRQIRDEYLRQIEAELTAVHHPRKKELLADVRDHLEQRFEKLAESDRTDRQFQRILEEMGPAEEYAELLKQPPAKKADIEAAPPAFHVISHLLTAAFVLMLFSVIGYKLYTADVSVEPDPMQEFILNFQPDPQVLGSWVTVDFVDTIEQFVPGQRQFRRDFFLKDLEFYKDMKTSKVWLWSKGKIFDPVDQKESSYMIKMMDGREYLFFEWLPGRDTDTGTSPYYVLMREGQAAAVPVGRGQMTTPMLPGMDSALVGRWITVDFVQEKDDFHPGHPAWEKPFYLTELIVYPDGTTSGPWRWKNNKLYHPESRTEAGYEIRDYEQGTFLLMEWMSGDVTIRGMKPKYYVLKKEHK